MSEQMQNKETDNTEGLAQLLDDIGKECDIFFNIINRFIGHYTRKAQRFTDNDTNTEYPFVAMDTRQVFAQIKCARDYMESRDSSQSDYTFSFIDIGCGIGNVLLVAEQFGFDVHGIEKDTFPREIAASLLDTDHIYDADIRTFDRYNTFDVLYYFCPLTDGQREFERHLEDVAAPGAIIIANYKRDNRIETDSRFKRVHPILPVWEKIQAN